MKIAYLVQDLADSAVERRVTMLRQGGAAIDLYGFRRTGGSPAQVAGVVPHELGLTEDGKLARRAVSLLKHCATAGTWARPMADADVIIARNLDNLVLAAAARRRLGLKIPLIYELLDIHTVMFVDTPIAALLRAFEGWLLRASDAVIISSPAFERDYLARYHPHRPVSLLVENKVLGDGGTQSQVPTLKVGPPWRIGWFGGIRCKPSLDCLSNLLKVNPGLFEVHIRGRFVNPEMGDVHAVIRDTPGMYFHGPYKSPEDLPKIYGDVHFAWAVDLCQEGANSDWLLPNRLYEGGLHGAIPIALRTVETGRWLEQQNLGLLVDLPLDESVQRLLSTMTPQIYQEALGRLQAADRRLFRWTDAECGDLVRQLGTVRQPAAA
jgi:succinoglycan biosynthesis protein ExoL